MADAEVDVHRERRHTPLVVALGGVTAIAPLAFGSAHAATQLALAGAALLIGAYWLWHRGSRGLRPVPFLTVAAVATAATAVQLLPLPSPLVALLSPAAHQLRTETGAGWLMPLTLDVPATAMALARAVTCLVLLAVVGGFASNRRRARTLLLVVVATGAAVGVIGIVERLLDAKRIFGIYQPQGQAASRFFGTFVDVNHAASVMALAALVAAGLAVSARRLTRALLVAAAAVCTVGVLFTTSRSGVVALAAGGCLLAVLILMRAVGVGRAILGATVMLLVGASVALWAGEGLRARLGSSPTALWSNQKVRGWADGMKLASAYPWTGVGRGAFEAPVNAFRQHDEWVRLVYPEDLLVQMSSEWGFPVTILLLGLALAAAASIAPRLRDARPGVIGAACGVTAVLLHELADFGLEMPGVAVPVVVALGVVVGMTTAEDRRRAPRGRRIAPGVAAAALACAGVAVAVAAHASPHTLDSDYRRLAAAQVGGDDLAQIERAIARHPAADYLELLAARAALKNKGDAMRHINRALELHPANWQAHRMAARLLASSGHIRQAALEYRLAVADGMNPDYHELASVLGRDVVDAAPQAPKPLLDLTRSLYGIGKLAEGDAAAERAVDLAELRGPVLAAWAHAALDLNAKSSLPVVAKALLAEPTDDESYALAARAFAKSGNLPAANAAIEAGLRGRPNEGALFLVGAQLRLEANDLAGARTMLSRSGTASLTLAQREQAEELLAQVADRSGDPATAVMARTRARLIANQLRDMTYTRPEPHN